MEPITALKGGKFLVFLAAFFAPLKVFMFAVGALVMIDFIFGIIAAKKQKQPIESKKMSKTIIKLLVYQMLIITAHICETYLIDFVPFVQVTLGFLAVVEFYSIGENFSKITGMKFLSYIKGIIMGKLKERLPDAGDITKIEKENAIGSSGDFDADNKSEK
jgi:phage-related holin